MTEPQVFMTSSHLRHSRNPTSALHVYLLEEQLCQISDTWATAARMLLATFRRKLNTFVFNISFPDNWTSLDIVKWPCSFSTVTLYRVAQKKRPELSHGVMQRSRWSESAEKHVCNEQTSSNVSIKFHLKRFHISRCTREIVLYVIKQCLQAVRHLCCWLYAGYTRTSQ